MRKSALLVTGILLVLTGCAARMERPANEQSIHVASTATRNDVWGERSDNTA